MPEFHFSPEPLHRDLRLRSLDEAEAELQRLLAAKEIFMSPGWDLPHVLDHCARSIEFAMEGFPVERNPIFQALIGKTAFRFFDYKGEISHNLTEEIPGSEPTEASAHLETAFARLFQNIHTLKTYDGPLKPHFAYGVLTKSEYERANAMHIANHLSAIKF